MKKLIPILALALCGCVNVPKTIISGTIDGWPFSISSPKDSQVIGLEITSNTNGVHIHIDSLAARMNPEVITTTGEAQAKLLKVAFDSGLQAVEKFKP